MPYWNQDALTNDNSSIPPFGQRAEDVVTRPASNYESFTTTILATITTKICRSSVLTTARGEGAVGCCYLEAPVGLQNLDLSPQNRHKLLFRAQMSTHLALGSLSSLLDSPGIQVLEMTGGQWLPTLVCWLTRLWKKLFPNMNTERITDELQCEVQFLHINHVLFAVIAFHYYYWNLKGRQMVPWWREQKTWACNKSTRQSH